MKAAISTSLRQYYFIGDMSEKVQTFIDTQNVDEVRQIQRNLLTTYEQNFSKHISDGHTMQCILTLCHAIPD